MAKKRVYKKGAKNSEYDSYHGTADQKKRRAQRNAARKKLGLKKGDPREASHIGAKRTGSLKNTKVKKEAKGPNRRRQPKRGKS